MINLILSPFCSNFVFQQNPALSLFSIYGKTYPKIQENICGRTYKGWTNGIDFIGPYSAEPGSLFQSELKPC